MVISIKGFPQVKKHRNDTIAFVKRRFPVVYVWNTCMKKEWSNIQAFTEWIIKICRIYKSKIMYLFFYSFKIYRIVEFKIVRFQGWNTFNCICVSSFQTFSIGWQYVGLTRFDCTRISIILVRWSDYRVVTLVSFHCNRVEC